MKPTISAVIITRNEAEMLPGLLESLHFCDEIVVVDSHSDDATRDIAASFKAKVIVRDFNGFGDQKEFARTQAGCDWVLSLDADERVPAVLADEILSTVAAPAHDAYRIPRLSYFLGKPFRHSYSVLGAEQLKKTDRRVSLPSPFAHAIGAFLKTYVLKRGFLGGVEGFVNAWIHGETVFWKYMLVYVDRRSAHRRQL